MVSIGKITGVHGIRGMLKVLPYAADNPQALLSLPTWHFKHGREAGEFSLEKGQVYQAKGLLLKFKGIDTPEAGRQWVGAELLVDRVHFPELEKGHYWVDLEGLTVETVDGVNLGRISHFFETGANDVMVVIDGEHERLIPYVLGHVVVETRLSEGKLIVDWDPSC